MDTDPSTKMLGDPEGVERFHVAALYERRTAVIDRRYKAMPSAKPRSTPSGLVNRRGGISVGFTHG